MANDTGPNSLPIVGHKGAPKKFKGKYNEVNLFIQHYERLCAQKSIITDKEKVENITQYCSRHVKEFMEGLPSYRTPNWAQFVKDILTFYDADKDSKRYKVRDLSKYAKEFRRTGTIQDLSDWRKYNRKFIRIAGWLRAANKITDKEEHAYFWSGIPKKFRLRLENRLLSANKDHDMEEVFKKEDVNQVAERLLHRNRFDRELLPSDESDSENEAPADSSDTTDPGGSASSGSSSENDEKDFREWLREKKKRKQAKVTASSGTGSGKKHSSRSKRAGKETEEGKADAPPQDAAPRSNASAPGTPP